MRKKKITVREMVQSFIADPEALARMGKESAELRERAAEYRRAEAPLVRRLRAAGYQVTSAWDLVVKTPGSYSTAVPILVAHLSRPYPAAVREGIARALAVPEAKELGWQLLVSLFRDEPEERVKDGLAAAIAAAADDEVIGDVIALCLERRHGSRRLPLLGALERSSDPRARAALMELSTDPDLWKEIQAILRRRKRAQGR